MNWLKTKIFCFFVKKEELSDEFSSSHVADSSSTFAYLDYIMNFLKVNVRDLAKAKYEDTYLLVTTRFPCFTLALYREIFTIACKSNFTIGQ